jgi:hypothetical protein
MTHTPGHVGDDPGVAVLVMYENRIAAFNFARLRGVETALSVRIAAQKKAACDAAR